MKQSLSVPLGILTTVNIMFGTGVLINSINLIKKASFWGFLSYLIVALLLVPLLFIFSQLLKRFPVGSFYSFAAEIFGPLWGVLNTWAYTIGKLSSATLLIHVFSLFFLSLIQSNIHPFYADICVLLLFMYLNCFGARSTRLMTWIFIILKLVPVAYIIGIALYSYPAWHLPFAPPVITDIFSVLPLVLYAFLGFEAACSLSSTFRDPQKNAYKILLGAFAITVTLTMAYQMTLYLLIGQTGGLLPYFFDSFNLVTLSLPINSTLQQIIIFFIYIASGSAALGGSYGMIASNTWNIYTLAHAGLLSKKFTLQNKYGVPINCVFLQGIICLLLLFITWANQIILQQLSVSGITTMFLISCMAYGKLVINKSKDATKFDYILIALGILSSIILIANCYSRLLVTYPFYFILFIFSIISSVVLTFYTCKSTLTHF